MRPTESAFTTNEDDLDLEGFAWAGNTGWISFCGGRSAAVCPGTVVYKTWLNNVNGTFKGHAWSPQLGYLSFDRDETGRAQKSAGTFYVRHQAYSEGAQSVDI